MDFRFFLNLITMLVLAFGILELKTYLDENFIENETTVKRQLNKFLNGELPEDR